MVFAFLLFWAFGGVLLLTCSALTWSERISVLRTVPACAGCGYDLTGLSRAAACPECAGTLRRFTAPGIDAARSRSSIPLWITPTLFGVLIPGALSVLSHIPSPQNIFGIVLNALAFVACAALLRILLRWITRTAAEVMMWCCIVALSLALGAAMLDATAANNLSATPNEVFLLGPLLTLPFAGYGLAGGIILLSLWRTRRPIAHRPPAAAPLSPMPPPRAWRPPRR